MKRIVIPYKPRYPEAHMAISKARFTVLVAHRRFGKTVLSVNHLLRAALTSRMERPSFAYIAPFRNQAKAVAWDYLKHYSSVVEDRTVNESELSIEFGNGARIRIFGADNPDALRGLYFDGVVLDEVAQMRHEVWDEIVQPELADRQGWALFIGTPKGTNLFSEIYERARTRQQQGDTAWCALCYRVDETNAIPAAEVERLRSELSESAWRQEFLCDFTASSDDVLITIDMVTEACAREVHPDTSIGMPLVMGVDVARFGNDASVICLRRGLACLPPMIYRGLDNMQLADRVALAISENSPACVFIDAGQGQGVIDRLIHMGFPVIEVPFGGKPLSAKFVNRRTEMWYGVREWLKSGGILPSDCTQLKSELTIPRYWYDAAGRIVLEPKDRIKERLGASPDIADALALTFAAPIAIDQPAAQSGGFALGYEPMGFGGHNASYL